MTIEEKISNNIDRLIGLVEGIEDRLETLEENILERINNINITSDDSWGIEDEDLENL